MKDLAHLTKPDIRCVTTFVDFGLTAVVRSFAASLDLTSG
ncbi:hypothetical protein TR2A62_1539 [Thalassobium sp. R2A62]|nr:hypothetical protein TR2A62_1539 [Thalassobium sp. R2A62]